SSAGTASGALGALATALAGTDGIVPATAAQPDDPAWDLGGYAVAAPHHLLPRHPDAVAQIAARVEALTSGLADSAWAVLLLAPDLAGDGCWDRLLEAAGAGT